MKKPVICCCLNVLFLAAAVAAFSSDSRVCYSVTVRSIEDLQKLQNCSVVAGHVRLVLLQLTNETLAKIEPLDIEEITDYLLIYRVHGLDTLERLFPKLLVIRGVQLLYDQYSLVIHENRNLENIGLVSLLRILRGSARIELNPSLCFVHTINWIPILGDTAKKYHYSFKNNKDPKYCPLCHGINPTDEDRHKHCWSQGKLQKQLLADYNYECYGECKSGKCNKKGKCCTGNCLTSCSEDNCRYCTNLIAGKKCVKNCIPPYALAYGRQCVLDCHRLGLIRLGGECVEQCPKMYREVIQHGVVTSCSLNCIGNFTIKTTNDLEGFADCTILQGSLTLELLETNKTRIEHLEKAFMNLREITGYFKITRSPQLVSLNFMRNLHTIGGAYLVNNIYSLYVVDNHYLEELWGDTQKVSILKGRIYFHLNPRLCYDKITALESQLKEASLTVMDVSPNSNGERIICGPVIRKLNATIDAYNANEARIVVGILSMEELTPLLGYIYFYKEAPHRNITKYDARHGCGQDRWFADIVITKRRRHLLRNLKPYTQYAFFAKTFTITNFHYQVEAVSDLHYFRTAPAKPGPLAKIYSRSLTANELELHWWPPRKPNGIIEKYLIHYQVANDTTTDAETKNQQENHAETCDCSQRDSETSGPTPLDEDYYEIEEKLYDESLNNFIYVAKRRKIVNKTNGTKISLRSVRSTASTSETTETSTKIPTNETIEESKVPTNASTGPTVLTEEQFIRAHEGLVRASIKEQDDGQEEYEISPVLTICDREHPTVVYKKENNCTELDEIESNYQVDGNTHTFVLKQLQPEVMYRIGIRACVAGLGNGCGPETVIYAETVSKRLEVFLERLKMSKADSMSVY